MAILRSRKLPGGIKVQLVSGEHIIESYNDPNVDSCMVKDSSARFYTFVKGMKLFRIVDDTGKLLLRALLWTTKNKKGQTVRVIDNPYWTDNECWCDCNCGPCKKVQKDRVDLGAKFSELWKEFADSRPTMKDEFTAEVRSGYSGGLPALDTFENLYRENGKLYITTSRRVRDADEEYIDIL
jgi:hypothetical protein